MLGKLKEKAASMIVVALLLACGYIAYDEFVDRGRVIEEMKESIGEKNQQITNLNDRIKKKDEFDSGESNIAEDKKKAEKKVEEAISEAKKYVDSRMREIDNKYNKLPKTEENKEAKRIEISLDRVRGLWAIYCVQVPRDESCK